MSDVSIRTVVVCSMSLYSVLLFGCDRPLRLLDEEQAALNGAPGSQVDPTAKQITATLSDPNLGRSGLTCRHCHGSSHHSSARFQPHPTLDVTSLKAQPDEGLMAAIGRCMEFYLLRPSFTEPSARDMSRYLVSEQPRHDPTLGPLDGASIYERACAHCHNAQLAPDLRRQSFERLKLVDVVEARGQAHGCLFQPMMIRGLFNVANRKSLEAFLRGGGVSKD